MMRRATGVRSGITLTEILISILIMGIGMVSLATLFPLGLLRIREANRFSRSTLLAKSAMSDVSARNLLAKSSFTGTWYSWPLDPKNFPGVVNDPYVHDPLDPTNPKLGDGGVDRGFFDVSGVYRRLGTGLPVAYDPLWRSVAVVPPNMNGGTAVKEARFAAGIVNGTNLLGTMDDDGGNPSAHGLQRITNLPVGNHWGSITYPDAQAQPFQNFVGSIFASPDDLVFQTDGAPNMSLGQGNPLAPDLSTGSLMVDWTYTWMFTGQQSDVTDGAVYQGDIVVFHNRPFALEANGTAAGERVVEAIFAYGSTITTAEPSLAGSGYSPNDHTILLRWPNTVPDPDVRVGSWIADVTYERNSKLSRSRFDDTLYPGQRCYWYRIVKRTAPENEISGFTPNPVVAGYRRMVVTIGTPVRAKTLIKIDGNGYKAAHLNAALVSPYVVNVFSKLFYTR